MPDTSGAHDLSRPTPVPDDVNKPKDPPEPTRVLTAFAVIIGFDGNPSVVSYEHEDIAVAHEPTPDLIFGACSTVLKDLQIQESAHAAGLATMQFMMSQAQAVQQQQEAARLRQGLGDLRG